jgi:ATP-dependent protease HslVU (ClpYQ) peptidase subunit
MGIHLPTVKLDYLKRMTDDTGVFQHAKFCLPKRNEGYTTDDNARALTVCTMYCRFKKDAKIEALADGYLAFLDHMQKPDGSFHNSLSFERTFLDANGSDDCMGRALRSLGCVVNSTFPEQVKMVAKNVFDKGLPRVWKSSSPRFYASTILGLSQYYQATLQDYLRESLEKLANSLVRTFQNEAEDDWKWFEPRLTYDNARLTQALFEAYTITGEQKHLDVAEESMDFLVKTQMVNDAFVPIGNDGWYKRGGKRAFYDQQPLEAAAMVEAAVDAYYATNNRDYVQVANMVFEWFLGRNSRKVMMYCAETGGCFDGLGSESVNMNQGAESSISYLLARLKLEELNRGVWRRRKT